MIGLERPSLYYWRLLTLVEMTFWISLFLMINGDFTNRKYTSQFRGTKLANLGQKYSHFHANGSNFQNMHYTVVAAYTCTQLPHPINIFALSFHIIWGGKSCDLARANLPSSSSSERFCRGMYVIWRCCRLSYIFTP